MAYLERFSHEEIPYEILDQYGLAQEMIDDLPNNVINRFLSSRPTPALPVVTENADGERIQSYARISLVRKNDGTVDICFAPRWEDEDLEEFTPEQQEKLKLDQVTTANIPGKGECYVQYDETINQVMMVPVEVINHNINIMSDLCGLDDEDVENIKNGEVVEKYVDDKLLAIGIDLKEPASIRLVDGDIIDWQKDTTTDRLPQYSFGLYGCWMADDENNLTYIPEEEYTEELIMEQKRIGLQNAAKENQNQLKVG